MAMVLLLLLAAVALKRDALEVTAIVVLVINMTIPMAFKPIAIVWLGASHAIGAVVSTVLLSIVYVLVVTPIGLLRRAAGKDALRLRAFKAGNASVMTVRNHRFDARDLEKPF